MPVTEKHDDERGKHNPVSYTHLDVYKRQSQSLPGYMTLPSEKQTDLQTYLTANTPKPLLEGQVNYLSLIHI